MAYGIEILGSELQYQVDSSTTSTTYFVVAENGTTPGSSAPFMIPASASWTSSDLVFARPTSGSGRFCSHFIIVNDTNNPLYNPRPSFNVNTEYLILRSSASAATDSNLDYGIQVKNSAASPAVIFDSRSSIGGGTQMKGFNIVASNPKGSLLGGSQAANALVTTNRTVYDSNSSDWDKVFVSVSGGFAPANVTGGSHGFILNGFYFDNVGYNVLHEGFITIVYGPADRANTGTILAGLVKS